MTNIYLTRHGQTEWNVVKRMQGHKNSDLTELGQKQAAALGLALKDIQIDKIYCSSSQRTLDTARLIKGNRNIEIIPTDDLMEISLGCWEGHTFDEVEAQYPEKFDNFWNHPEKYVPIDGETFEDVRNRTAKVMKLIAEKENGKNILVVTHGIVLKTIYTYFMNQDIAEVYNSQHPRSTCLCHVIREDSVWKVMKWNDTDHYKYI